MDFKYKLSTRKIAGQQYAVWLNLNCKNGTNPCIECEEIGDWYTDRLVVEVSNTRGVPAPHWLYRSHPSYIRVDLSRTAKYKAGKYLCRNDKDSFALITELTIHPDVNVEYALCNDEGFGYIVLKDETSYDTIDHNVTEYRVYRIIRGEIVDVVAIASTSQKAHDFAWEMYKMCDASHLRFADEVAKALSKDS
jgi:hypothetical protein